MARRRVKRNKTKHKRPTSRPVDRFECEANKEKKKQRIPCEECFAFFWNADSSEFIAKDELEDNDDDDVVCDGGKKKNAGLDGWGVSALNELLSELEWSVQHNSETLIAELALRDELEFEKELKNTFISLLLNVQNKRRQVSAAAAAAHRRTLAAASAASAASAGRNGNHRSTAANAHLDAKVILPFFLQFLGRNVGSSADDFFQRQREREKERERERDSLPST